MNLWTRIGQIVADGVEAMGTIFQSVREVVKGLSDVEARRQLTFTIAMIALSAKMAKADGVVTQVEADAFLDLFSIPPGEERNVARIYDLAKRDVSGFEAYARNVARLMENDRQILEDVLDGLFHIAKADGVIHERELAYLERVGAIFGFDEITFQKIASRHYTGVEHDPYIVLGADPSWSFEQLQKQYRNLVRENHPDRLIGRGVPEEFVAIATERLAAINHAWDAIEASQGRQ